jgi:hypothetical protein
MKRETVTFDINLVEDASVYPVLDKSAHTLTFLVRPDEDAVYTYLMNGKNMFTGNRSLCQLIEDHLCDLEQDVKWVQLEAKDDYFLIRNKDWFHVIVDNNRSWERATAMDCFVENFAALVTVRLRDMRPPPKKKRALDEEEEKAKE